MTDATRPSSRKDAALPARRREELLRIARRDGQATVVDLAATFDVSLDTIRRDIDHLVDLGLLARTHGGAVPVSPRASTETSFDRRMQENQGAKRRIAQQAAGLIHDGETVIFNGGTTTLAVAAALGGRDQLTVVTNNLLLPTALPDGVARGIYLVGGTVQLSTMTSLGPLRFPGSEHGGSHALNADLAVLGVCGISAERGVSVSNLLDARMTREMVEAASQVVIVADATKVDHDAFAQICSLDLVDILVSNIQPDHPAVRRLEEGGGRLISSL